jgi:hypothetical protein
MSEEWWADRLEVAHDSVLAPEVDPTTLARRYDIDAREIVDQLAAAAGSKANQTDADLVRLEHFDAAAEELGIAIDDGTGGDPSIEADGGPASPERLDELEGRIDTIEDSVDELQDDLEDLYVRVDILIDDLRSAGTATGGEWGDRHV